MNINTIHALIFGFLFIQSTNGFASLIQTIPPPSTSIYPYLIPILCTISSSTQQETLKGLFTFAGESSGQFWNAPNSVWYTDSEYDFVVVGAGTGGTVVANRLSENPQWKVLLLEAGGHEHFFMDIPLTANYIQFTWANWNYKTEPGTKFCRGMVGGQCNIPRGKVMGGSSVLNYMIYTRGNRRDYDGWEKQGNFGWGYKDVLPYFKKIEAFNIPEPYEEAYHGKDGYVNVGYAEHQTNVAAAFLKACLEFGINYTDYNGRFQQGVSRIQTTTKNGLRHSSNKAYLFPIHDRPNLHIKKHSFVTKIDIDPHTKETRGVYYNTHNPLWRNKYVSTRKEVIVCAGAINTPQLLMLSGIGPKQHLEEFHIPVLSDLKVGFGLQDHIATGGLTFLVNETCLNTKRLIVGPELPQYLNSHTGPLSIPGGCEVITFNALKDLNNPDGWPDIELLMIGGSLLSDPTLYKTFGIKKDLFQQVYGPIEDKHSFMVFPMLLRPKSRGRIKLKTNDPFDYPLIHPNYLTHPQDIKTLLSGIKLLLQITKQPSLLTLNTTLHNIPLPPCAKHPFASDSYFECMTEQLTFNIYHQSGTCKMGTDAMAVVDPRLRVYGVKGLRVIDASVIPEIPAGHTNAPVFMIAEKGSDMIREDWGGEGRVCG